MNHHEAPDVPAEESVSPAPERQPSRRNPWLFVGGLFLLGLALALVLFGGPLWDTIQGEPETELLQLAAPEGITGEDVPVPISGAPLNVGDQAHAFELPDLNGERVRLEDFRGQPVVVNFWATWCPPCRLEMPEFQRAHEANVDKGLVILAINEGEQVEVVRDFFHEEMGFTYTALLDADFEVGTAYGAVGLPATFFIDKEGRVAAIHRGIVAASQLERYLAEIMG